MATRTRNYNLIKPDGTDLVDIDELNSNFNIIDTQLKANADRTAGKQDALTFDDAPTEGSTNLVTSGGVYAALHDGHEVVTFDEAPVSGSRNAVRSGGIYTALLGKQNDLTQIPIVSALLASDYLFLQRDGAIYKIRASAVIIPSGGGNGIKTEDGETLLTEDGQELLLDEDEPDAVTTQSGEQLLTESSEVITI